MKIQKIKPDPKCEYCNGSGEVIDYVDYGSTVASMSSICDCVTGQSDEDTDEIKIILLDWVGDGPGWGQEDISPEEYEQRMQDWDNYWV